MCNPLELTTAIDFFWACPFGSGHPFQSFCPSFDFAQDDRAKRISTLSLTQSKWRIVQCFLCLVPCETDSSREEPWDDRVKRISTLSLTQSELGGLFSAFYVLFRAKLIHCRENHALRIAAKILFVSPSAGAKRLKRRAWPSSGNALRQL